MFDFFELQFGTNGVRADTNQSKPTGHRGQATPYANSIHHVPSGVCYARIRVRGKRVRRCLKPDGLAVAKLRHADLEKVERQVA